MGRKHQDGSQGRLNELFQGFPGLVQDHLELAIRDMRDIPDRTGPVRVLDIGAGAVPYAAAFAEFKPDVEAVFVDRDDKLPGPHVAKLPAHRWFCRDFLALCPPFRDAAQPCTKMAAELGEPFDVIVLAASVHELYFDAVIEHGRSTSFHEQLFAMLRDRLLKKNGRLVLADYAWPSSAPAAHTWRIRQIQEQVASHADPPWAFLSVSAMQRAARRSRLRLLRSISRGLHDEAGDEELRKQFDDELKAEELETLRLRIGYVGTFAADVVKPPTPPKAQIGSKPRAAANYLSRKAEPVFERGSVGLIDGLNQMFLDADADPALQKRCPLCHLAQGVRERAEERLAKLGIPDAGVFELWANFGFKGKAENPPIRFVPALPIQWMPGAPRHHAGVLSTPWPHLKSDPYGRPYAGRTCIPYERRLGNSNLHQWFTNLHASMRKHTSTASGDVTLVRSVTLIAQDPTRINSESTARSFALASQWGDRAAQTESGHYLAILQKPVLDDVEDRSLVTAVNTCLAQILTDVVGDDEDGAVPHVGDFLSPEYELFLRAVFYENYPGDSKAAAEEAGFGKWWTTKTGQTEVPHYRAFTTVVWGCDGLSVDEPDSIMLFSTQALPPSILDAATEDLGVVSRRLSSLESAVLVKTEARAHAAFETSAKLNEEKKVAVAGFTHQVGHVLGRKSEMSPLSDLPGLLLSVRDMVPDPLMSEIGFRAAQIRYAALLPDVFNQAIVPVDDAYQSDTLWLGSLPVEALLKEQIWNDLLGPLVATAPRFRSQCVSWNIEATSIVPACDLVRAVIFELFWNAFRHGTFANDNECVTCSATASRDVVDIVIENPCPPGKPVKKPKHVKTFIKTLRGWTHAPGHEHINVDYNEARGRWKSTLTLPKYLSHG